MAGLLITTGAMQGQRIDCDRPLVFGREDVGEGADVVIDDAEMSRRHAVVTPVGGGLEIADLGSLNGTFVNGNRISGTVLLEPNSEVKLGTTKFTVELPPAAAPIVAPSNATVMSDVVKPASDEPVAPLPQPTVVRGQPVAPAPDAGTASDQPVAPVLQPTVVRGQAAAPAADAGTASDQPVAPLPQPTVVRSAPIVPDADKTALRDQPLIATHEPTVVRDVAKGLPTPGAAGGVGAPVGPPKIPKPVLIIMKSPAGKLLLPIMLKLPPKARPLVPLLFVVGNLVGLYFIIRLIV